MQAVTNFGLQNYSHLLEDQEKKPADTAAAKPASVLIHAYSNGLVPSSVAATPQSTHPQPAPVACGQSPTMPVRPNLRLAAPCLATDVGAEVKGKSGTDYNCAVINLAMQP
jgi:hypothetical protein